MHTLSKSTRSPLRRALLGCTAAAGALSLALSGASLVASPTSASAATSRVAVDFGTSTGAFRGGATGTLYGLGDDGSPSPAVLAGAHVTNTSQKPPQGTQHPNGDALDVEHGFFSAGGKDLYVYLQDEYPDWAYNGGKRPGDANGDGEWDYLPLLRKAVEAVATKSEHPEKYVFIPFNEPDGGNWYPDWANQKSQFLADWSAAYDAIQQIYAAHGLGKARIGGPGDSVWRADRSRDLLAYAKQRSELPDVFIWHELGTQNLATFRGHDDQYQGILRDLGLPDIPVDITEYGMLRDMGVPGQLVQWLSMFEDRKVDAQTAYWNYAGNLSDNSARSNGANGGWWMFKWYGDLAGSRTVKVTPPQADVADTVQAIGARDDADGKATVLVGGGSSDIGLDLTGLDPASFGTSVDVVVRAARLNGAEGLSRQPPVVLSTRAALASGATTLTIPNSDRYSAYEVQITKPLAQRPAVDSSLVSSVEAEATALHDATVQAQDPTREWSFMASGGSDVGGFDQVGSSATWNVTVPRDGTYRLSVLAGAGQAPGQHALFVDGAFGQLVKYSADLSSTYRGSTDVLVPLRAGTHSLSLRASRDGTTRLPGSAVTLDRFELRDATDGEPTTYPATEARLASGARLVYQQPRAAADGGARLGGSASASFFVSAAESGYHDVAVRYTTEGASSLGLRVGDRSVPAGSVAGAGAWSTTVRVWLTQGVNEIGVSSSTGVTVTDITTTRGSSQRAADTAPGNAVRVEAEQLARAGATAIRTLPASSGSNGSADAQSAVGVLGSLGGGAGNTATMTRPSGLGAGDYVLTLSAANADKTAAINYNPQVISRFVDVSEAGGARARVTVRHDYSWSSFWDYAQPVTLTTAGGALTLGNASAYAPDIDTVTLAKQAVGSPVTTSR
ncbi:CBM35 domain-containing protein [Clavibacter sp. Sh2126]|uniref:CBM35 domain-containing protein n=1 Tax=unclassified Clavibacter TaxID=2626594 RepID=UPI0039E08DEE